MTVLDVITRAAGLAVDKNSGGAFYRFTKEEYIEEYNSLLLEIGNELDLFTTEETIAIFNGQKTYEFKAELMEIKRVVVSEFDGDVILPSSIQTFEASGRSPLSLGFGTYSQSVGAVNGYQNVIFSDLVSYGKFQLSPTPSSDTVSDIAHVWTA